MRWKTTIQKKIKQIANVAQFKHLDCTVITRFISEVRVHVVIKLNTVPTKKRDTWSGVD